MATRKQRRAARRNIKKAQKAWQKMSKRSRALAQPQGRGRKKPGTTGRGKYFHITVRPKGQFTSFRTHDVGRKGGLQRVAGHRKSGSWADQKWIVSKKFAHVSGNTLVPDTADAKKLFKTLGSKPKHVKGDVWKAKPRPNVPERKKPTAKMKRAQSRNIKKAQAARRKKRR